MLTLYLLSLGALSIYSYVLIDPNLTLVNHPLWSKLQEQFVYIGYYRRDISSIIYIVLLAVLFFFHIYFVKRSNKVNPVKIAILVGIGLLISYPFLSHDFFNYLFDAKILTFYHQNPYLHKPLDFPNDQWLRFMHWTHRTYPYGPVFLVITLIPSFLSFGKFILSFFLFKLVFIYFYVSGVWILSKINKKSAMMFATSPIILFEGLVSTHNDLIAVVLAFIGIYFIYQKRNLLGRLFLLFSGGIKYITLPLIALSVKNKLLQIVLLLTIITALLYLSFFSEIQPWYFLALFSFLPFFGNFLLKLQIFFFGLLLSYYPFIRFGDWGNSANILLKHQIILFFLALNIIYLVLSRLRVKFLRR